jgi:hypothetical protein
MQMRVHSEKIYERKQLLKERYAAFLKKIEPSPFGA